MGTCSLNATDSNQSIDDLINQGQVLYMTVQRKVPQFCMSEISG